MRLVPKDSYHNHMNELDLINAPSKNGPIGRILLLAEQWDQLSSKAKSFDWNGAGLMDLAKRCGLEWYVGRGNESLAKFLKLGGNDLTRLPGFGSKKLTKLCEILSKALEMRMGDYPPIIPFQKHDHRSIILEWGIPEEFPCKICLLPVRVQRYCAAQGIVTVGQLLDKWKILGYGGFKSIRNLGAKSVRQLETLMHALENRDRKVVGLFLPLSRTGTGVSLSAALASCAQLPKQGERAMLERRLIKRMTLEESAEEAGVTRERVRQLESEFLGEIRARLDYFMAEREELLNAWLKGRNWFEPLLPMDDEELARSAIEAIFEETPQACAKDLNREVKWDQWCEEMRMHSDLWFGGVILDDFFTERSLTDETEEFCECIASCRDLRIDHVSGRVFPVKTGLYNTVLAMLHREDDPIPLTWLLDLLVQTGHHPDVTRKTLKSQKSHWLKRDDFPSEKIIWSE